MGRMTAANGFTWRERTIPFQPGESIAAALVAAGVVSFGAGPPAGARYFCGIGTCQGCLVRVDGVVREACLTPAVAGGTIEPLDSGESQ